VHFIEQTPMCGIPTIMASAKIGGHYLSGSRAHLDGKIALMGALCELTPKLMAYDRLNHGLPADAGVEPDVKKVVAYGDLPNYSTGSVKGICDRLSHGVPLRLLLKALNAHRHPMPVRVHRQSSQVTPG